MYGNIKNLYVLTLLVSYGICLNALSLSSSTRDQLKLQIQQNLDNMDVLESMKAVKVLKDFNPNDPIFYTPRKEYPAITGNEDSNTKIEKAQEVKNLVYSRIISTFQHYGVESTENLYLEYYKSMESLFDYYKDIKLYSEAEKVIIGLKNSLDQATVPGLYRTLGTISMDCRHSNLYVNQNNKELAKKYYNQALYKFKNANEVKLQMPVAYKSFQGAFDELSTKINSIK